MRLGIDLGGTKIEGIVLGDDGAELARRRIPTPAGDYHGIVAAVAGLVGALEQEVAAATSVGIGHPGTISPATGLIKNSNSTSLNGRPLDRDLEGALQRELRMANDANCLALSEATDGAGAGATTVFAVILGTGVGGGIAVDGRPIVGRNAIAGEWGHNPLPWLRDGERPGPDCYCGLRGCTERYLSGPGMAADHERATGERSDSRRIFAAAAAGDRAAAATVDRYCDRLARGLAAVVNVLDPDVIVVGGGLSNVPELYRRVPESWAAWAFTDRIDTPLLQAVHGDSSGVRGAAWLWPR